MRAICGNDQTCWVEAVRFPDEEFTTLEAESENYAKVTKFNTERGRETAWSEDDYRSCHTVALFRSASKEA